MLLKSFKTQPLSITLLSMAHTPPSLKNIWEKKKEEMKLNELR